MTSDDKIQEYYKQQNIFDIYQDSESALENILFGHEMFLEQTANFTELCDDMIRKVYDDQYKATIESQYISINELRNMTIKEIVDFLK